MDPREDFEAFYRAHVRGVLAYFARRCGSPELAADLAAETFAAALAARRRYDPARGDAAPWLYGIARMQLLRSFDRRRADDRLRRRLSIETPHLDARAAQEIEELASGDFEAALAGLPAAHRAAVRARILDERDYDEIARSQGTTNALVRQRVSRGLAALRSLLGGKELR